MKTCTKCKIEKSKSEFNKNASRKDGLQAHCRTCRAEHAAANKERKAEYSRLYRAENKEQISSRKRQYYAANREKILESAKLYRENNKDQVAASKKKYYTENREQILMRRREYRVDDRERQLCNMREWHENNPNYSREYHIKNKSRRAEYRQEYYANNREREIVAVKEYRDANPETVAAITRNRRARIKGSKGSHTGEDVQRLLNLQRYRCAYCETCVKDGYHVDHVIALSKGGGNGADNLQILCPTCNMSKGAKCPVEFARQCGKLL